jgi:hypothetical protein
MGDYDNLYVSLFSTRQEPDSILVSQYEWRGRELVELAVNSATRAEIVERLGGFAESHDIMRLTDESDPDQGAWVFYVPRQDKGGSVVAMTTFVDAVFDSLADVSGAVH